MQKVGTVDVGYVGNRYTWQHNQDKGTLIKERLDRSIASLFWLQSYEKVI